MLKNLGISGSIEVNLQVFILNLLLTIALSVLLRYFYIHFGTANTNRRSLADNFPLLAACVCLVIFLIQGSLALSLGLVGALSIVRFRAAIKEPEELVYLFFAIAIGLGFGAGQRLATTLTFFILLALLYLKYRYQKDKNLRDDIILHVNYNASPAKAKKDVFSQILTILEKHCLKARIRRMDDMSKGRKAYMFGIEVKDLNGLNSLRQDLLKYDPSLELSFIENSTSLI